MNNVTTKISPIINIIDISPQNQTESIIHLRGEISFLVYRNTGKRKNKIVIQSPILTLKLCSWGEIEATLIKKISNPPINTIT